jgi:hypothetical protein
MLGFLTLPATWSGKWRLSLQASKPISQIRPEAGQSSSSPGARSAATLSAAEMQEAAALLADSFDDSPLFRLAFPRSDSRKHILRALFIAILKDATRFGGVEIAHADQIVGVVIWYPPGGYPVSMLRILRLLPDYLCIVAANPLGIMKLCRAQIVLNRYRPKQPHCHGYFLCARPGSLVGGLLIRRVLNEVDKLQLPMYLETQESRCTNLYGRFGFKLSRKGFATLPHAPPTWTMWRDPRPLRPPSGGQAR